MHLPNGRENTVRFSGVSEEPAAKKVQNSNGFDAQEHALQSENPTGAKHTNENASKANDIQVHLPNGTDRDSVLDTVLTAWAILIQRYQRDVFHQFTWGQKDQENAATQCISVTDIDWANQQTAASLRTKISSVKSNQYTLNETTLFLNDGTTEEVISTMYLNQTQS
ncbi:hypothetical protein COCC4DRAFT_154849 [Bipolaris maydis ATCC 48331]|uniref:Uncharacterized protein n=1 Tax=Cochliobolus heterostrophus (strain C4 / ATCC 48331 / race T) TaxID=665024 RepID=N4WRH8_COCH4|nr:uncharacterized protein COCC4DRAFT_154849 [Bipolaris maydis ATCC 48331]ENH98812.1 hypothetical protein COCC4DRAFT_154849 [Bipolaris maydis ATCC 48331]